MNVNKYLYKVSDIDTSELIECIYTDSRRVLYKTLLSDGTVTVFKPSLNLRIKKMDIPMEKRTYSEYGELIAHLLLKQSEIPSCRVRIATREIYNPRSKSKIGKRIPGAISYFELKDGEEFIPASTIVWRYVEKCALNVTLLYSNNIEVILPAFMWYAKIYGNATDKKIEQIKQSIIDMTMFDCRNGNKDRNNQNFGLALDKRNKTVRFYPLFDNEHILGFSESNSEFQTYTKNERALQEHVSRDLYSSVVTTETTEKISSELMFKYLFSKYPEEAVGSYKRVKGATLDDLLHFMNACEGLPEERKAYAIQIFNIKGKELDCIFQEYMSKKFEKTLPVFHNEK